jgi:lactate racemase
VALKQVELLSTTWYGDTPITINFPSHWDVIVIGEKKVAALTNDRIWERINNPIGSPRLSVLASKRKRAAIIMDDITRPTPTAKLIPFILEELKHAGIKQDSITIVIAGGTHRPASREDIIKKAGINIVHTIKVIPHDCRGDLRYLGKSSRGTPLYVNQAVMECDLKIGVGGIYPHPAAGFSGGPKIIMPASCGIETVRYMHDYLKGANQRGGSLENELRLEMEEVATKVGLDFIVNVVLNQKREIAGLFVGDKILAHRQGVEFATQLYSVTPLKDADIILADMYPFDVNLQFAYDRGFWPVMGVKNNISKVVVAACPMGLGCHDLYPLSKSLRTQLSRRVKNLKLKEFRYPISKIRSLKRIFMRKQLDLMMLSAGVTKEELRSVFPKAKLFNTWDELLVELKIRHRDLPVKVAVYKCGSLLIPNQDYLGG